LTVVFETDFSVFRYCDFAQSTADPAKIPYQQSTILGLRKQLRRQSARAPITRSHGLNQFPSGSVVGILVPSTAAVQQILGVQMKRDLVA
jgi:hypothetical protein